MKAPQLFGLAVRIVGLGFLAVSIRFAYSLVAAFVGDSYMRMAPDYAVCFVGSAVAAWLLLRRASWLVRIAYPPNGEDESK